METVIRIVIASLAAAFTLSATAQAAVWTPAQTQKAITVADAHWPASHCAGVEAITWVQSATLTDFAATAYASRCAVTVAWNQVAATDRSPGFLCTVLEHEFGHLSGLGHSSDSNNVMFATVWKVAPDCAAAFPAPVKLARAGIPTTVGSRSRKAGRRA